MTPCQFGVCKQAGVCPVLISLLGTRQHLSQ
jgi:hypothetical protein